MNIKKHCVERYIERVDNITDKNEIRRIANTEGKKIEDNVRKMYEHANFLWRGQLFDNITRNYYINGDWVLVVDTDSTCVITMWKADLGLPAAVNKSTIKGLLSEIFKLNEKVDKMEEKQRIKVEKKEIDNANINAEIAALEAKITALKQRKTVNEAEISAIRGEVMPLRKELDQYATLICNSIEFKNDLLEMKKVG